MRHLTICLIVLLTALDLPSSDGAAPATDPEVRRVDFAREILPVLSDKCFVCHGPDSHADTDLRLDSFEGAVADRGGYRALDPDAPDRSEILVRIHDGDAPMPPPDAEKQLTDEERQLISRWVREGGRYARHWSFVPPKKADPGSSESNPIDGFIQATFPEGVTFADEADRPTLARRAALVLTGLPPEPKQLDAFLSDDSPAAWNRLLDDFMSRPQFGEHQARYWLDAVRYGDTHGLHLDNRRGIYPYRDWVVRAFNENLPLDDFIRWQLAGDLLPETTLEQRIATGYVRLNPTTGEGGVLPEEFQAKNNFDRTENFGTVFLGMSLTCARCHTHKYDPIPHREYYRLLAFFNSTAEPPLDRNAYEFGPTIKVPPDQASWKHHSQLLQRRSNLLNDVAARLPTDQLNADQATTWKSGSAAQRLALLGDPAGPFADQSSHAAALALQEEFREAEESFTTTLVAEDLPEPRPTKILRRGEYDQAFGEELEPGVISAVGEFPADAPRNRLGLAAWLTSRDNPLVARVLINRVWQNVFGEGLVRTPEDFGLQGQQPTHPELLDWLAVELQESGWDFRHMLRLMLTSRTFRQDSAMRPGVTDPANKRWARGPRYRLDAEVIRDMGLWASGLLDPHMGGEGVKPYQPAGMWQALAHPASNTKEYVRDTGSLLYRRSLYVYWKRTSPHPMMTLFDAPDRESSCVRRSRTSTSLQSLGLFNETQRLEMGRFLAARLIHESGNDVDCVNRLFGLLACRPADEREQTACLNLLREMRSRYESSPTDASALLSLGDAPADETIPAPELAAWSQVAMTVLASDIALMLY